MKNTKSSKTAKVTVFLAALVVAFLFFSFFLGRKPPVKNGEVGLVRNIAGDYRIFREGEKPFVVPFFQNYTTLSTGAEVISLVGEDGYSLPGRKEGRIESQVTYSIDNPETVAKRFGLEKTSEKIRDRIKKSLFDLLKRMVTPETDLNDPKVRIPLIAEIHLGLNESLKEEGISILSYRIRME